MANLGEKLKAQIEDRAAKELAIRNAHDEQARKNAERHVAAARNFLDKAWDKIVFAIENDKPLKGIVIPAKALGERNWVGPEHGELRDIYAEFADKGEAEGLRIRYVHNHDGVGIKAWYEIKVGVL